MLLLGIDIGGTKTSVCVGNHTGEILESRRIPTHSSQGPDQAIDRTLETADALLGHLKVSIAQIDAIGLSTPGPVSVKEERMLAPPNMPGWINVPIMEPFRDHFHRPVFMNNDANACALAEYLFGTRKSTPYLVYLTMSTGLGAGVIVNGQLLQGTNDLGGEIGHHVIDAGGPPCPCGQRGCLELYCGGKNVADWLRTRIVREDIRTRILDHVGGVPEKIDFKCFTDAVRENDAFACAEWDQYLEHLAQGVGTVIMFYNPEVIIMGTIAIHAGDLLLKPLRERLYQYAWKPAVDACRIEASGLGIRIGDLSALAVAIEGLKL